MYTLLYIHVTGTTVVKEKFSNGYIQVKPIMVFCQVADKFFNNDKVNTLAFCSSKYQTATLCTMFLTLHAYFTQAQGV